MKPRSEASVFCFHDPFLVATKRADHKADSKKI